MNDLTNQVRKGRFMPQDLFDGCVCMHITSNEAGMQHLFSQMLADYRSAYPSEDGTLAKDIEWCSAQLTPAFQKFLEQLLGDLGALDGKKYEVSIALKLSILKSIRKLERRDVKSRKPFLKRFFEGTRFYYETQPLVDRKSQCIRNFMRYLAVVTPLIGDLSSLLTLQASQSSLR